MLPQLPHWQNKSRTERLFDMVVGSAWAAYAILYVVSVLEGGALTNLGLFFFYTLVAFLFLARRPARRGAPWWQTAVAAIDALWPILWLRPAVHGYSAGQIIQGLALLLMVSATLSLGFSFGIAPADRGLKTTGTYRVIRHPLYTSELLFYVGYLLANLSWHNALGLFVSLLLVRLRIYWEENIIEGYHKYAQTVRWRLLPHVW